MQTGADLFVAAMVAGGVDTVYGVPGEETNDLLAAITASQALEFIMCRHEQGAALMASVHGRLTGQPAACLATLGPGATNLVTGVADATLDFAPMLVVTGQAGLSRLRRESHQVLDLEALFDPVTKHSRTLLTAGSIPGAVSEALYQARAARPGAVHLSLPEDIAAQTVADVATIRPSPHPSEPLVSRSDVLTAAKMIRDAKTPVMLCGAGVIRATAADAVRRAAEAGQLPVVTSFVAKGVLPEEHALHGGVIGLPETSPADTLLGGADLVISVGFDPVEYEACKLTDHRDVPIVAISQTHLARDAGLRIVAECLGDLDHAMSMLADALDGEGRNAPLACPQPLKTPGHQHGDTHPRALLDAINRTTEPADIVLSGVGNHKFWLARGFQAKRPGQIVIANGLAGMGLAVPGAIAAARLYPDTRVLAVCGDGDVMMNVQELATAAQLDVALTVCVWVDGGYGLIEKKFEAEIGETTNLAFAGVDWSALASAFGWTAHLPTTQPELEAALRTSRAERGRHLIVSKVTYPDAPDRD